MIRISLIPLAGYQSFVENLSPKHHEKKRDGIVLLAWVRTKLKTE